MNRRPDLKHISVMAVSLLALLLVAIPVLKYGIPFSWDVWYHIRMGEAFTHGFVWWDWGSFGPTGRPNLYPPAFHILLAMVSKVGGWSTQSIARCLPLLFYPLTAFLVYWFSKLLFSSKVGVLSSLMYILMPVAMDRGVISSPQAFATILMLLAMIFLIKSEDDWRYSLLAGASGAGVVLTHGLTLIMLAVMVAVYVPLSYVMVCRGDREKGRALVHNTLIFIGLTALLPSYWLYYLFEHGVYSSIPESAALALVDYPAKLGLFQLTISFVGVGAAYVKRGRSEVFMMIVMLLTFLLTTSFFWVLPSRYIEFLTLPVSILAGLGLYEALKHKREVFAIGIVGIFLVTLSAPLDYVDSIAPLVNEDEEASFLWLRDDVVVDGQIITGWFFAPIGAAISMKVPIKGAYSSGSFGYRERTDDTNGFYNGDMTILEKYNIKVAYVGRKERYDYTDVSFMDERDNLNKLYACAENAFYGVTDDTQD